MLCMKKLKLRVMVLRQLFTFEEADLRASLGGGVERKWKVKVILIIVEDKPKLSNDKHLSHRISSRRSMDAECSRGCMLQFVKLYNHFPYFKIKQTNSNSLDLELQNYLEGSGVNILHPHQHFSL